MDRTSEQGNDRTAHGVITPWEQPDWESHASEQRDAALAGAGHARTGPVEVHKSWARSRIEVVPTDRGPVWVKYSYGLPPGEECVLERLVARHAGRVPDVIATWDGALAMAPLPGRELTEDDGVEHWISVSRALGEVIAG
ncbi:MAG: hypothetical protein KDB61_12770, partial [Planctomycetes bacterium]|nr:hypothetical protein [Planctomycetota bacterium]